MGYSAAGGPNGLGVITDSNTPLSDLTQILELIARVGNFRGAMTEDERDDITGPELYAGLMVFNTDVASLELYDGSGWAVVWTNDQSWAAASLTGSWVNFGGGLRAPAYRIRGGTVKIRGTVKSGGTGNANPIFTLPVGFRPSAEEGFIVPANVGHADLRVDTSGRVFIAAYYNSGNNGIISLAGINFEV